MTRFLNDQNKLVFLWESGTYGAVSGNGVWPGMVQSVEITENQNVIQTRFLGQGNRNVGVFQDGPLDFEGTVTLFPQDWRLLGLAMGSIAQSNVSLNFANHFSEVNGGQRFSPWTSGYFNPWASFQLEESKLGNVASKNSVRTLKGCVPNSFTLNITQGEPISVELGIVAQSGSWVGTTPTAVTAGSNRPYLWSDATWQMDGVTQEAAKSVSFSINNNFEMSHYVNGSRVMQVPFPKNRDYSVEVTQDLDANVVGSLYNSYFQAGSKFNAILDINYSSATIGSHRLTLTFSGCRMTDMSLPLANEGVSETTYTLIPGSVTGSAWDRIGYTLF